MRGDDRIEEETLAVLGFICHSLEFRQLCLGDRVGVFRGGICSALDFTYEWYISTHVFKFFQKNHILLYA